MSALTYDSPSDFMWNSENSGSHTFLGLRIHAKKPALAGFWTQFNNVACITTTPPTIVTDTISQRQQERITIAFLIKV